MQGGDNVACRCASPKISHWWDEISYCRDKLSKSPHIIDIKTVARKWIYNFGAQFIYLFLNPKENLWTDYTFLNTLSLSFPSLVIFYFSVLHTNLHSRSMCSPLQTDATACSCLMWCSPWSVVNCVFTTLSIPFTSHPFYYTALRGAWLQSREHLYAPNSLSIYIPSTEIHLKSLIHTTGVFTNIITAVWAVSSALWNKVAERPKVQPWIT